MNLEDADVSYHPNFFNARECDFYMQTLRRTVRWRQNKIRFYGKESLVPRLEAWYGDKGKSYSYSGITMHPDPWTSELNSIKERLEKKCRERFNSVLINLYRDGKDRVAWHSDDEKELGNKPTIASISFGEERKFRFRHKGYDANGLREEIVLESGSLLLMRGNTQENWKHEVPKTSRKIGPRINLTFRRIK